MMRCCYAGAAGHSLRVGLCAATPFASPLLPGSSAIVSARRFEAAMKNESVQSSASAGFKAPPNVGPGRQKGQEANPYKSWEHMSHKWLILTCVGCLAAGYSAGQIAEVDESKIKPKFDRAAVVEDILKTFEFRPDLAPTALRVAFVLAARRAGYAGTQVDESCAVVNGLEDVAGVYSFIAGRHNISMEDIASLTAITAIRFLRGPCSVLEAEWRWGRDDKEAAQPRKPVPPGQTHHSVPTILKALGGLSVDECVALLGVHAVGEFHENVSGVENAKHMPGKGFLLGNHYFKFLLEQEKKWKCIEVARTQENRSVADLPKGFRCVYAAAPKAAVPQPPPTSEAPMQGVQHQAQVPTKKSPTQQLCVVNGAMVDQLMKRKEWRLCVEQFAADPNVWEAAFQRAFLKMIDSNFSKLRSFGTNGSSSSDAA